MIKKVALFLFYMTHCTSFVEIITIFDGRDEISIGNIWGLYTQPMDEEQVEEY